MIHAMYGIVTWIGDVRGEMETSIRAWEVPPADKEEGLTFEDIAWPLKDLGDVKVGDWVCIRANSGKVRASKVPLIIRKAAKRTGTTLD